MGVPGRASMADSWDMSQSRAGGSGPEGGPTARPPRTAEEIQDWIAQHLAKSADLSPDQINVTAPFSDLAVDSATAIGMTGDLQDWLGRPVDPMMLYDYPTIEQLAEQLAKEVDNRK